MSMGAICFTFSSSNGGCWVVLVSPPPPFFCFLEKRGFFPHTPKNFLRHLHPPPKKNSVQKKRGLRQKKSCVTYAKKKKRVTLISAIELHFLRALTPIMLRH